MCEVFPTSKECTKINLTFFRKTEWFDRNYFCYTSFSQRIEYNPNARVLFVIQKVTHFSQQLNHSIIFDLAQRKIVLMAVCYKLPEHYSVVTHFSFFLFYVD